MQHEAPQKKDSVKPASSMPMDMENIDMKMDAKHDTTPHNNGMPHDMSGSGDNNHDHMKMQGHDNMNMDMSMSNVCQMPFPATCL